MNSRSKGKRGERTARLMLGDRDWTILANTADGSECEDIIARSSFGDVYSIEVKCRKLINIAEFKKQAIANAAKKKLPWMLMAKIEGTSSWLVLMKGAEPTIWRE